MSDGFLFDKLSILNQVYNNSITQGKVFPQSSVIKTKLYPHQCSLVNGMHLYRDKMTRGFLMGNQAINGKIGIIGNSSGTGKTLCILAYLASQIATFPRITCELTNFSTKYFFSHELTELSDTLSTNLIIVPHSLFNQWKQEIAEHTTMNYIAIETKRVLKDNEMAQKMINASFILTTNSCYKQVQAYADEHRIQWNNVIIDEASSIYINSSDPKLNFQFLWLVTSNWIPLIFRNPSLIKSSLYHLKDRIKIHPELDKWLQDEMVYNYTSALESYGFFKDYLPFYHLNRANIVLRNSIEQINDGIKLESLDNNIIHCRPTININSLISYYLTRNVQPNISSEKIPGLFQALYINFKTKDEYILDQPEIKHNLIKRKCSENECSICLEQFEYPTIVKCCYNIFCGKCLLRNMITNQKCPTCRDYLEVTNICCLNQLEKHNNTLEKNKLETCLDLFNNNRNGKFIVYSSFDNIYYQLFEEIIKLDLKAERAEGNMFSLLKTIKNYQEGKTNILFLSNVELIRGLSLASTSHLIFYHEQPVYELKQVLIHSAQRIGRKQPLKIIHLNSEIQI
jgi:SNF2 family DNA or RNA helicase